MPLFEFVCTRCQHRFEDLVSATEKSRCPKCESAQVKKQLSVFAVGGPAEVAASGPCGTCGDPRGPGSCRN